MAPERVNMEELAGTLATMRGQLKELQDTPIEPDDIEAAVGTGRAREETAKTIQGLERQINVERFQEQYAELDRLCVAGYISPEEIQPYLRIARALGIVGVDKGENEVVVAVSQSTNILSEDTEEAARQSMPSLISGLTNSLNTSPRFGIEEREAIASELASEVDVRSKLYHLLQLPFDRLLYGLSIEDLTLLHAHLQPVLSGEGLHSNPPDVYYEGNELRLHIEGMIAAMRDYSLEHREPVERSKVEEQPLPEFEGVDAAILKALEGASASNPISTYQIAGAVNASVGQDAIYVGRVAKRLRKMDEKLREAGYIVANTYRQGERLSGRKNVTGASGYFLVKSPTNNE